MGRVFWRQEWNIAGGVFRKGAQRRHTFNHKLKERIWQFKWADVLVHNFVGRSCHRPQFWKTVLLCSWGYSVFISLPTDCRKCSVLLLLASHWADSKSSSVQTLGSMRVKKRMDLTLILFHLNLFREQFFYYHLSKLLNIWVFISSLM